MRWLSTTFYDMNLYSNASEYVPYTYIEGNVTILCGLLA